jgi:hypothetical protein
MPSLTYAELAQALKITPESANRLARRKHWPRMRGNDGKTRVAVPEETLDRQDSPPVSPTDRPPDNPQDRPPDNPVHVQIARLEGELAGMREALTEARTRAGAAEARLAAAEARDAQHVAQIAAEQAKVERAFAELSAVAERLAALAEERSRPWWRRIVG